MMRMKTLMVDDMRLPKASGVTLAVNAVEALEILKADSDWDFIYLDHDLGTDAEGNVLDIWPVMAFIDRNRSKFRETVFYIVSSNPAGAERMQAGLASAGILAIRPTEMEKALLFDYRDLVDQTGY